MSIRILRTNRLRTRPLPPVPVLVSLLLSVPGALRADCSLTSTGNVPLPDLGTGLHQGFEGGLYPGGRNVRPTPHLLEGLALADEIEPLDPDGVADPGQGQIVMISVGMSNTASEFTKFVDLASADPAKNPRLVVLNGAQGGQAADSWSDPAAATWDRVEEILKQRGLTPSQVQVAWVKQAERGEGPFPDKPLSLEQHLENIARNLRIRFPNLKIAYFSSRTRAYTESGLSPEPTAYETAFAVKWMIEKQISGDQDLATEVAPWLSWGPYLWADGLVPRSDGFVWECEDTAGDFIHPSASGREKVARQLLAFFKTDPTSAPWFLAQPQDPPVVVEVVALPASGEAPLSTQFFVTANDSDGIGEYVWTFDDGTFSYEQNPTKTFHAAGIYEAHLAVVDTLGNAALRAVVVSVGEEGNVNQEPVPRFTASPDLGPAPLSVDFDASDSFDPDGSVVDFRWDFGDGELATGPVVAHVYQTAGSYDVLLTVTDDQGASATLSAGVEVTSAVPVFARPAVYRDGLWHLFETP